MRGDCRTVLTATNNMSIALDIILIIIFLITILLGVRRGFIKSAARFIGTIIAACLAAYLGGLAAQWIFDALFRDSLLEKVNESISGLTGMESIVGVFETLPDFIVRALESAGVTTDSLMAGISTGQGQVAEVIVEMISPVFIGFIKVLTVIVLFMLLMIVVRVLSNFIDSLFDLPILNFVNSALGGVFGFLTGLLVVWIVVAILQVFTPMLSTELQSAVDSSIESSVVASIFLGFNPFAALF